jgi:hypothetical protein
MIDNDLIWLCTRKNFTPEYQSQAIQIIQGHAINWNRLYDTVLDHKVAYIVVENLLTLQAQGVALPAELLKHHRVGLLAHIVYRRAADRDLEQILEYFHRKSVDILVAKGTALSLTVFQGVSQYTPGDLDILLRNELSDISCEEDSLDIAFFKSLEYYPEWERNQHHDLSINGLLPIDFERIWQNAVPIERWEQPFRALIMCPEHMLLFACISACRKRYFRLKSVLDIAEIINFYPGLDWEKLRQDAKAFRCQTIVYTALVVTQLTVGCNLPEKLLRTFDIGIVRAALIWQLVQYITRHISLIDLKPTVDPKDKRINVALLLVAVTYDFSRITQRLNYLWQQMPQWRQTDMPQADNN